VGGSTGALEPFRTIASALPRDLPVAVFMVMHLSPDFPSNLDHILDRASPLKAVQARDGEPIRHGHIYVPPPDRHLTLVEGRVRVQRGPRENRHRPAIDPLFRSAARAYGPRVTGVVVSGYLDDGAAGLLAVRARGGYGIVQDPDEATSRQMPDSALRYGGADKVLPVSEIGPDIVSHVKSCKGGSMKESDARKSIKESEFANLLSASPNDGEGVPSPFSCPECGGVLWELKDGKMVRFRCRVGHAYTMNNLQEEQGDAIETALWAAMRALEEKAALETRLSRSMSDVRMSTRLNEQAEADRNHAETIRKMLFRHEEEQAKSADYRSLPDFAS
jgi:two-component system, chemotaxis family, protein-glutamate methylesterase/glutaminase